LGWCGEFGKSALKQSENFGGNFGFWSPETVPFRAVSFPLASFGKSAILFTIRWIKERLAAI
jgi:hypothetical protein